MEFTNQKGYAWLQFWMVGQLTKFLGRQEIEEKMQIFEHPYLVQEDHEALIAMFPTKKREIASCLESWYDPMQLSTSMQVVREEVKIQQAIQRRIKQFRQFLLQMILLFASLQFLQMFPDKRKKRSISSSF